MPTTVSSGFQLPLIYSLFFLTIEPISALVGAYYAHFQPQTYLDLTSHPFISSFSSTSSLSSRTLSTPLSPVTTTILTQLSNLYLLFAINEALVLRSTSDLKVWRTVLFGLLIADLGHLWSVRSVSDGWEVYYSIWRWNEMYWGNLGFVYVGALMRMCFLSGLGLGGDADSGKKVTEKGLKAS